MLTLLPPAEEKRLPFARLVATLGMGTMTRLDAQGRPDGIPEELRGRAILSREGAEALFASSPRRLDTVFEEAAAGKTGSFALPLEVRVHTASRHQDAISPNVLGVLRGSDPVLAKEYVVVSAHLDHLGIGAARDGDAIYNGAYDNASGTAAIIEVARALAAGAHRPARSVLFAAVTAEEKGLLGAEHFVKNPTVPIGDVVADLNMDMFLTLYPVRDVVAFGAEHSSLGPVARDMAKLVGLELSPDPFPEEVIFVRSDHYAFVRGGIPALMLACGLKSTDPKVDGAAVMGKWIETVYHSPKDDMSQAMDFDSAAKVARLYALIADRVAREPKRPTWNPGDFFAARFAR
jgi:Zn-dependent M28 family amino/carboxypeptidase